MNRREVTQRIRRSLSEAGFEPLGVTPAITPSGYHRLCEWIEKGFGGTMEYLRNRKAAYQDPKSVLSGVRSIVVGAWRYPNVLPPSVEQGDGRIARYASIGIDYHDVIHNGTKPILRSLRSEFVDESFRVVVDTAPLLERDFATHAGLGWRGKNTLVLRRDIGSYFFLFCLLTTLELEYDDPFEEEFCGRCTACLDHCPTDALVDPHVLDARKCISYLTIEHRGSIDRDLRLGMGDWIFGCDVCQEVCPWNRRSIRRGGLIEVERDTHSVSPLGLTIQASDFITMSDDEFRKRFRKTPLWRTGRVGMARNAAIVLGNSGDEGATGTLVHGLSDDSAIVREACVWALWQIGSAKAKRTLRTALESEDDQAVRLEIELSLETQNEHNSLQ
ncbi:MAG: tRNA epoxyqueuosine(34) reductase QueG [Planctomycetota bacterium]